MPPRSASARIDQPRLTVLMLMMRRHEKDFMLRGDEKYGDELRTRVSEFKPAAPRASSTAVSEFKPALAASRSRPEQGGDRRADLDL